MRYLLTAGGLFLACVTASRLNLPHLGIALFPIPIAVYLVRRHVNQALGLVACAALAGWWSVGAFQAALTYGLLASVGLLLGVGLARRWTYGWTLAGAMGLVCGVMIGGALAAWDAWLALWQAYFSDILAQWQLNLEGQEGGAPWWLDEQSVDVLASVRDQWAAIGVGTLVWFLLMAGALALSVATHLLRRWVGIEGLRGSFRTMRLSEWVVWAAIGAALFWFVDYRWLDSSYSIVSWNAAIGLAAVYWLNGLSIMVHAFDVLRPSVFLYAAVVLLLVTGGLYPLLCCLGLFDTWWDFRKAVDGLAERRRQWLAGGPGDGNGEE